MEGSPWQPGREVIAEPMLELRLVKIPPDAVKSALIPLTCNNGMTHIPTPSYVCELLVSCLHVIKSAEKCSLLSRGLNNIYR